MLPPLMLPVALINPAVLILPPVMLPLALIKPVVNCPVDATTTTLDVPPIPNATFALAATTRTFDVPFWILVASMPDNKRPLPRKKLPLMLPTALIVEPALTAPTALMSLPAVMSVPASIPAPALIPTLTLNESP